LDTYLKITLDTSKYLYEDWPNYGLSSAIFTCSPTIKAYGLSSKDRAYLWFRDIANDYFSGAEPGNIANRTISNATITLSGLNPDTLYEVQYFDTYNSGGPIGSVQNILSSGSGTLVLSIPSFQRDRAVKILKSSTLTSIRNKQWQKFK